MIRSPFIFKDRDLNHHDQRLFGTQYRLIKRTIIIFYTITCIHSYTPLRELKRYGGNNRVFKTSIKLRRCPVFCTRRVFVVRTRIFRYDRTGVVLRLNVPAYRSADLSSLYPKTPTASTACPVTLLRSLQFCRQNGRPRSRWFYTVIPAPVAAKTFVNIGRVYRVSPSCIVFPVNSLSTYDFITVPPHRRRGKSLLRDDPYRIQEPV